MSISPRIKEIRSKIESEERITRDEALFLAESAPLTVLGEMATIVRERKVPGDSVTYLIDRNINYTNVCNTTVPSVGSTGSVQIIQNHTY